MWNNGTLAARRTKVGGSGALIPKIGGAFGTGLYL